MKYSFLLTLIIIVLFSSCTNFPKNIKDREYSGIVINKFRKWNHDDPCMAIRMKDDFDTTISVWSYEFNNITLYDAIEIGDSISKQKGNYSITVWHKKSKTKVKYELKYKGEWYYDGHD